MVKLLKNISRIVFIYVSFVVTLTFFPNIVFAQTPAWQITDFDVQLTILENGHLDVQEKISVVFNEQRRGIFRTIPVVYKDRFQNRVKTAITIKEVLQDSQPAETQIQRKGKDQSIRIGNEDVYLSGAHHYDIRYEVENALLFFSDIDELYWNVTGHDWEVPIENASITVHLPNDAMVLRTSCYVGEFGSTSTNCGVATTETSAAFVAEDFLTVAVGFTKGVISPPSTTEKILLFLKANSVGFLPLLVLLVVFFYWWKHGKDERIQTIVAEFQPPESWKAVYTAYVLKDRIGKDFAATMMIQLAVDGYLTIDVQGKSPKQLKQTFLVKTAKSADELDAVHKGFYDAIFHERERVSFSVLKLDVLVAEKVESLKKEIRTFVQEQGIYTPHSFRSQVGVFIIGIALVILSILVFGNQSVFALISGIASALIIMVIAVYMPKKTARGLEVARKAKGFKLFMHTAERYRSRWQEEQGIFEKYLPYAIAFGDTKQWAKILSGLDSVKNPTWYQSTNTIFVPSVFANELTALSRTVSTITVKPSSSGSSGSGSSGGGFGGGGGGSW